MQFSIKSKIWLKVGQNIIVIVQSYWRNHQNRHLFTNKDFTLEYFLNKVFTHFHGKYFTNISN